MIQNKNNLPNIQDVIAIQSTSLKKNPIQVNTRVENLDIETSISVDFREINYNYFIKSDLISRIILIVSLLFMKCLIKGLTLFF